MAPDSASASEVRPPTKREARLRLVLQRLTFRFYQRPEVLHQVAARILSREEL